MPSKERKGPAVSANDHPGKLMKGEDGNVWQSKPVANGKYHRWFPIKAKSASKICKSTEIMNPMTGKCVSRKSKLGKSIIELSPCKPHQYVHPVTGKCVNIKAKKCKAGEILNLTTGRCVKSKSPAKKGKSPAKKGKSPAKKGKSPAKKGKSPAKKGKSPAKKGKSPAKKGKSPAKKGKSPAKKGKSPAKKALCPGTITRGDSVLTLRTNESTSTKCVYTRKHK